MKILVIGHACSPQFSSEPAFTWNWAWHLSERHQVWVIAHPQYRQSVEDYLAERPNPNLSCVWVTLPSLIDPWDPARGERGVRLHYLLWQREAFRVAQRLHRQHRFDITHLVSLSTISVAPVFWRLPVPFIWGPVGGGQMAPAAFRQYFGSAWWKEALRNLRLRALLLSPGFRRAVRQSAAIFVTNRETARFAELAGARRVRLLLDCGCAADRIPASLPKRARRAELTLLWAARLEHRKSLPLGLEALARVKDLPVRLLVAGGGPRRAEWEALSRALGLADRVQFLGVVPWSEMARLQQRADAFLFTSLRDSFGSVVLEAMSQGLPVVALDHQGVGSFVPPEAGIKVPVTTPGETVAALARALRRLALATEEERQRMGAAGWAYARTQTWERRVEQMSRCYEECLRMRDAGALEDVGVVNV
jgi:glycosyltransferase involved in cell wall biosynthesis